MATATAPVDNTDLEDDDLGLDPADTGQDHHGALLAVLLGLIGYAGSRAASVPSGDPSTFGDKMEALLTDAHARAAMLGRRLAGVPGDLSAEDRAFAGAMMEKQAPFLAKFVADIQGGRYTREDGTVMDGAINARATLYANALQHTATAAWVAAQPEDTQYDWNLGGANNCNDCPDIAEGGPYTAAELPGGGPGGGASECLANCQCYLAVADGGAQSFDLGGEETVNET